MKYFVLIFVLITSNCVTTNSVTDLDSEKIQPEFDKGPAVQYEYSLVDSTHYFYTRTHNIEGLITPKNGVQGLNIWWSIQCKSDKNKSCSPEFLELNIQAITGYNTRFYKEQNINFEVFTNQNRIYKGPPMYISIEKVENYVEHIVLPLEIEKIPTFSTPYFLINPLLGKNTETELEPTFLTNPLKIIFSNETFVLNSKDINPLIILTDSLISFSNINSQTIEQ